jgi:hypothetical protein
MKSRARIPPNKAVTGAGPKGGVIREVFSAAFSSILARKDIQQQMLSKERWSYSP